MSILSLMLANLVSENMCWFPEFEWEYVFELSVYENSFKITVVVK